MRLTNENGETTRFRYDPVGRLLEEDGPQRKVAYRYAEAGGRLTGVERDGVLVEIEQDAMGRIVSRRHADERIEERFAYDAMGRLWHAQGQWARLRWDYDALGRVIEERQDLALSEAWRGERFQRFVWRHEYDALGNRLRSRRPDGRWEEIWAPPFTG